MISYNDKELQIENDICKNHSDRMERVTHGLSQRLSQTTVVAKCEDQKIVCEDELQERHISSEFRLSASKLSRQKLEDLYFELLQNNRELKRTLNIQHDKIKVLSTKVLRMTSAQVSAGKEQKECCASARAAVIEQKNIIADLKQANARMSEKVRMINMRLCSAKQFLKTTPQSAYRCTRCRTALPLSIKISSSSALNSKRSEENDRLNEIKKRQNVDSEEYSNRNVISTRTVETETSENDICQLLCEENKCKLLREELEQKIVELQKEIDKMQSEHSNRVSSLKQELSEVRSVRADAERRLRTREHDADLFANRIREAEAQSGELTIQLCIERKRVVELETRLKIAEMSTHMARTVQYLSIDNIKTPKSKLVCDLSDVTPSKYSDDSGYAEQNSPESKELTSKDNELMAKMAELQAQLDSLKNCVDNEMSYDQSSVRTLDFISYNVTQADNDALRDAKGSNTTVNGQTDHINSNYVEPPERDKPVKYTSYEMEEETVKYHEETFKNQDAVLIPNEQIEYILEDNITRNSEIEYITKGNVISNTKISAEIITEEENVSIKEEIESARSIIANNNNNTIPIDKPTNANTTILNDHKKHNRVPYKIYNKESTRMFKKLTKSKSADEKVSKITELTGNRRIESVDIPTSTVITHIKPSSMAMEIRFEEKMASTDQMEVNQLGTQIERSIEEYLKNSPRTYTVESRASSPENTDHEISSLTDLPTERDEKTPRILSPGEERFTTTYSASDSSTTFENVSLSEGELPGARRLSAGEREITALKATNKRTIQESSSHKIQSTLRAVSEELSRCKHLLLNERPKKVTHSESAT